MPSKDPTRTTLLRRQYVADMRRRLLALRREVRRFIGREDELGLAPRPEFSLNARQYEFLTDDRKSEEFRRWLANRQTAGLLETIGGVTETPWTAKWVHSGYRRGLVRAFLEGRPQGAQEPAFFAGRQRQFLEDAFAGPERVSKLRMLATRSFNGMKGITDDIASQLNRILADGMLRGDGPGEVAAQMSSTIDTIGRRRAFVLARTEIIHAHAEGQLDGFEDLGIEELGVDVEISTAGDDRVCPLCEALVGRVFTVAEARGVIPVHPQCRCSWTTVRRAALLNRRRKIA